MSENPSWNLSLADVIKVDPDRTPIELPQMEELVQRTVDAVALYLPFLMSLGILIIGFSLIVAIARAIINMAD